MRRYRSLKNKKPMKGRAERGALDAREKQEKKDYATVHARSGNRCEVELKGQRCTWTRMPGCHHVTKRSQGGKFKGPDYLIDVCWPHHDLTDNASASQRTTLRDGTMFYGRLRIVALGGGKFRFWMETSVKHRSVSRENTTWPGGETKSAIGGA